MFLLLRNNCAHLLGQGATCRSNLKSVHSSRRQHRSRHPRVFRHDAHFAADTVASGGIPIVEITMTASGSRRPGLSHSSGSSENDRGARHDPEFGDKNRAAARNGPGKAALRKRRCREARFAIRAPTQPNRDERAFSPFPSSCAWPNVRVQLFWQFRCAVPA